MPIIETTGFYPLPDLGTVTLGIRWGIILLLLLTGVGLSLFASKKDWHWAIVPVIALVGGATIFSLLGEAQRVPHPAVYLAAVVLLLLIAVIGGNPLVHCVLQLAGSDKVELGSHGGILVNDINPSNRREILRGGTTIGYLERLAIAVALLIGQPAAVAIIVAVKGLGRFNELENSAARERFIIGTLVSMLWAAVSVTPVLFAGYHIVP